MADPAHVLAAHEKYALPLGVDPAENTLITGGFDGSISIWSTDDWSELRRRQAHSQSVNCGGITSDGHLVTGSTDTTAKVWSLPHLEEQSVFEGHAKTVAGLTTHSSDGRVATASYDRSVRVWVPTKEGDELVLDGHPGNVTCVTFADPAELLVSGGLGDALVVWALADGTERARLSGHGQAVVGVTVDPDGQVWSAGYNGTLFAWSDADWTAEESFELPIESRPTGLRAHPSDNQVAVSRDGGMTLISDTGEVLADHDTTIKGITAPLWSPEGSWVAVGGADGKIRIYE
jgi:WD40 repeat protein